MLVNSERSDSSLPDPENVGNVRIFFDSLANRYDMGPFKVWAALENEI